MVLEAAALYRRLGDASGVSVCCGYLGHLLVGAGNYAQARPYLEESLAAARRARDDHTICLALGFMTYNPGACDDETRLTLATELLARSRTRGFRLGVAMAQHALGYVALGRGDDDRARACLTERYEIARALGDVLGAVPALYHLAEIAARRGAAAEAERRYREAVALCRAAGAGQRHVARCLSGLGKLAAARGDRLAARAHFREALDVCAEPGGGTRAAAPGVLDEVAGFLADERPARAVRLARRRGAAGGQRPAPQAASRGAARRARRGVCARVARGRPADARPGVRPPLPGPRARP